MIVKVINGHVPGQAEELKGTELEGKLLAPPRFPENHLPMLGDEIVEDQFGFLCGFTLRSRRWVNGELLLLCEVVNVWKDLDGVTKVEWMNPDYE